MIANIVDGPRKSEGPWLAPGPLDGKGGAGFHPNRVLSLDRLPV